VIFYNTDYFKRIGFPDAEVSIGKVTQDGIMKGGHYKRPEELTYPFRQFVYLIQREESPSKDETSSNKTIEPSEHEHTPGFFERLGNYSGQISKGVQSGIDKLSPYLKTKSTNLTEVEKPKLQEGDGDEDEDEEEQTLRSEEEENEKIEKEKRDDFDKDSYWIVRIPIVNDDSLVPKNEYEKAEEIKTFLMLENKVELSLGKSKVGELYFVGSRVIRMCEEVKEYEDPKIEPSPLPGSIMAKLHTLSKDVSSSSSSPSIPQ